MPFTGVMNFSVEAKSEKEAIEKFWEKLEENGTTFKDPEDPNLWCDQLEYQEHITEGNFFHGVQNSVEVILESEE
jgi:hypothetical protein